ncbi:MAG: hypothetical protein KF908_07220 [Nitrosomonas sp.]|nr:hypothetical protein [Nitrosomonas sp.]
MTPCKGLTLITAAAVIMLTHGISGMEGLAVFYLVILLVAPLFWFGCHWMMGKLVKPSLTFSESMLIAGSPIALGLSLVLLAHQLQSIAWSTLRFLGITE